MNLSEAFRSWSEILLNSAGTILVKLSSLIPNLIGALIVLIIGWFIAKLFKTLTKKTLKWTGLEKILEKSRINETFKKIEIHTSIDDIAAIMVFWIIFLVFVVSASEVLGISVVLSTLNSLILYLPNVLGAIIIIIISLLLSRFVKDVVAAGLSQINMIYAMPLARTAELLIIIFGFIIAIAQLGFDMSLLMANITIFIGGFVAIVALSLGLGSKTLVQNLLAGYYARKLLEKDQQVILLGRKGKIKQMNNLSILLETEQGDLMVPNHKIIKHGSFE